MIGIQDLETLGLLTLSGGYWHDFYIRNGGTVGIVMTVAAFLALIFCVRIICRNLNEHFNGERH